jgi:arginine/lysine/ornithine decarboxylase
MTYNYEIYNRIDRYKGKDKNRLHMPGHKNVGHFKSFFPVAPIDVTELSYSDDLNCPSGAIRKAQDDLAEITGAKKAFITTDGSSSGVFAMVYAASKFGNKIIVPRNSHKSVFNACRVLGIEPVIVQGREYEGILLPPDSAEIEKLIVNDVNIAGLIITSPDYYGNIAPLEEYATILKKYDRLLFADGAHGAHLLLEESRAGYCGVYADMWVDGAHKTLPTLTQGALVLVNNDKVLPYAEEALSIFRTTSPSYPIMASVEYGVKYFVNNPKFVARAKALVTDFKNELSCYTFYPSQDWTKLALDCKPLGIASGIVAAQLEKKGIYAEMNDGRYILFYLSPAIEAWQLNELKGALAWITAQKKNKNTYVERPPLPEAERTYSFLYAHKQKSERVLLKDSVGKMCAENAGITPPCLPVVIAGEIISAEAAKLLSSAKQTFGIENGKIKVVKK